MGDSETNRVLACSGVGVRGGYSTVLMRDVVPLRCKSCFDRSTFLLDVMRPKENETVDTPKVKVSTTSGMGRQAWLPFPCHHRLSNFEHVSLSRRGSIPTSAWDHLKLSRATVAPQVSAVHSLWVLKQNQSSKLARRVPV